jgi:membrane-associated PAP2 superfamily phosphatase
MLSLRYIAAIAISIVLLTQLHGVDLWISDAAYDFSSGSWTIDHATSVWRNLLYDGPKALLILFALVLIGIVTFSPKKLAIFINRREAAFLLICLAVGPGVVGAIKHHSGVSCPYSIQRYGGEVPDSLGRLHISTGQSGESVVGCWPSGHASGGFALLALAFLPRSRRVRTTLLLTSLTAGSATGVYQVLRGAHFASHILITLCICLLLIGVVASLFPPFERSGRRRSRKPGSSANITLPSTGAG